ISYPEEAHEAGEEGRVIVQFIVNKQGEVEEPKIMRGVSESLNQEALRVVKQAQFKPGGQRGQPVRVQYSLPIIFKQSSSITKKEPKVDVETPKMEGSEMKIEDFHVLDNGTLSGKIISTRDNTPLPGANIVIEETSKGSSSDKNGEFSFNQNLEKGTYNLVVSYIGYDPITAEIKIK
ncbi:MAG TPA: TonB family protein, partial [Fodinibius sp.]|nr:TonB family protein [Fodinibius sp.]